MGDNHLIWAAGITNEELESITNENFDRLSDLLEPVDAVEAASGGVAAGAVVRLWPFVIAYTRGNISKQQLTTACTRVLPESGKALASRLAYSLALGPVFAWWLLARGVLIMTPISEGDDLRKMRRMILDPESAR